MKRLAHPMSLFSCCVLIFLHAMVPIGHKFFMHSGHAGAPATHSCCSDHDDAQAVQHVDQHADPDLHGHACCDSTHHHSTAHEQSSPDNCPDDACCHTTHHEGTPCQHDCDEDCPLCAMALAKIILPLSELSLAIVCSPEQKLFTPTILCIARGPDCVRERGPPAC